MKVDNAFDKTELLQHLKTAYALPLQSITFLPEGEDSYGYIATSETGEKYFAKASTSVPDICLQYVSLLRYRCDISGVVAPLETSDGRSRWDLWKVGKDFTDAELDQTAALLATIHLCTNEIDTRPAEKDLVAFTGERFDVVLDGYVERKRNGVTLHVDIFGFYIYEWTLNEIRDYSTKILFKNKDTQQNEYDWESLQDYLPPNRELMEDGIAAIQGTLDKYGVLPK
ncbi:hypothetical protein GBAR_LOCUS29524 [Geodia barretti]|uniref:Uncharacterized protein n=1 Tax=Geodia barretti TaxID=519541 RepID=A0AA35TUB0_GEOBA|nr:hypothetical protein GBAR_LOCUS29524 [Geodia barretti]